MAEREPAAPGILFPAQLRTVVQVRHPAVQVNPGAALLHNQILLSWLCQSQAQTGPASANTPDVYPNAYGFRLVTQAPDDLCCGRREHFHHRCHLPHPV